MSRNPSIKTKLLRGYGQASLDHPEEYQPWIHVREFRQGNGTRHIVPDLKYPQRQIHLLSNLELAVYMKLRKSEEVLELFEQFPLDPRITACICNDLNIKHPTIPGTKEINIMTTDFVAFVDIEGQVGFRAYAVKMFKELEKKRVAEKLRIEQVYWEEYKGVPWKIIDENFI